MNAATDRLKKHTQSQLDLSLDLCQSSFGCCQKAAEINAATSRKLFALLAADTEPLFRGNIAKFFIASGDIAIAYWASTFSCGLEFQRQCLTNIAQK